MRVMSCLKKGMHKKLVNVVPLLLDLDHVYTYVMYVPVGQNSNPKLIKMLTC
jgi:hypothetical protein